MLYTLNLHSSSSLFAQIYSNLASCIGTLLSTYCFYSQNLVYSMLNAVHRTFMKSTLGQYRYKWVPKKLEQYLSPRITCLRNEIGVSNWLNKHLFGSELSWFSFKHLTTTWGLLTSLRFSCWGWDSPRNFKVGESQYWLSM
jgi:hypothetical protein